MNIAEGKYLKIDACVKWNMLFDVICLRDLLTSTHGRKFEIHKQRVKGNYNLIILDIAAYLWQDIAGN